MLVFTLSKANSYIKEKSFKNLNIVIIFISHIERTNHLIDVSEFYVPTFRCLRAPSIYFDDFLSTQLYLSAFHFRFDSDQCYIEQYSCQLKRTKRQWINTTYHTVIDVQRDLVNITVDYPSEMIEPLTKDHLKKGTTLNDHISEKVRRVDEKEIDSK